MVSGPEAFQRVLEKLSENDVMLRSSAIEDLPRLCAAHPAGRRDKVCFEYNDHDLYSHILTYSHFHEYCIFQNIHNIRLFVRSLQTCKCFGTTVLILSYHVV